MIKQSFLLVATRIAFWVLLGFSLYGIHNHRLPENFFSLWSRWDSEHYLSIAKNGYEQSSLYRLAFFPFYPFLIRIFSPLLFNAETAGWLISQVSLWGCVIFLHLLTTKELGKKYARNSTYILLFFPTAYFLHSIYTESLFLFCALGTFYFLRSHRWLLTAIFCFFACLTRLPGIALGGAVLWEIHTSRSWKKSSAWLALIAPALSLFIYLVINNHITGNPLAFLKFQEEKWGRHLVFPWVGFMNSLNDGLYRKPLWEALMIGWGELLAGVLGYASIVLIFIRLPLSYGIFSLSSWLLATSNSFWMSNPRFCLTLFPMMMVLAPLMENKTLRFGLLTASLLLQIILFDRFVQGQWAY